MAILWLPRLTPYYISVFFLTNNDLLDLFMILILSDSYIYTLYICVIDDMHVTPSVPQQLSTFIILFLIYILHRGQLSREQYEGSIKLLQLFNLTTKIKKILVGVFGNLQKQHRIYYGGGICFTVLSLSYVVCSSN